MEPYTRMNFSFTKQERLHLSRDFRDILRKGRVYTNQALKMFISERDTNTHTRLGLVVSRKLGKVVLRNKLKRRLREIFRLNKHLFNKKVDMVFLPRDKAVKLDYQRLQKIVSGLWRRAKLI